jgi:hypothetical protein
VSGVHSQRANNPKKAGRRHLRVQDAVRHVSSLESHTPQVRNRAKREQSPAAREASHSLRTEGHAVRFHTGCGQMHSRWSQRSQQFYPDGGVIGDFHFMLL